MPIIAKIKPLTPPADMVTQNLAMAELSVVRNMDELSERFGMKVHRANSVWPMMDDYDIERLADSINRSGLLKPILVQDGVLLDGKNRLAACKIAGVEPTFKEFEGDDPTDYIFRIHYFRPYRSRDQVAMHEAILLPDDTDWKVQRGFKESKAVLKEASHLVGDVINDRIPLMDAYQVVLELREEKQKSKDRLIALESHSPDDAKLVNAGLMTLEDAYSKQVDLPRLASVINISHEKAQFSAQQAMDYALTCGDALNTAKGEVEHGQWLPWLNENTAISERTARRYMKVANNREQIELKTATVTDLSVRGALEMLSTPKVKTRVDLDRAMEKLRQQYGADAVREAAA